MAQLVVSVAMSGGGSGEAAEDDAAVQAGLPRLRAHTDDTLLQDLKLEKDDAAQTARLPAHVQALILGLCHNVENTKPQHG